MRVLGEVTRERLEILRHADAVVMEELRRAGLYRQLSQAFAVLPADRTVGVMGDQRTYAYFVVLRAVTTPVAQIADEDANKIASTRRTSSAVISGMAVSEAKTSRTAVSSIPTANISSTASAA